RQRRVAAAAHDGEEPGAGVDAVPGVEVPEGADVGVLRGVLGVVIVAEEPAREAIGRAKVRRDDGHEGGYSILALHGARLLAPFGPRAGRDGHSTLERRGRRRRIGPSEGTAAHVIPFDRTPSRGGPGR